MATILQTIFYICIFLNESVWISIKNLTKFHWSLSDMIKYPYPFRTHFEARGPFKIVYQGLE